MTPKRGYLLMVALVCLLVIALFGTAYGVNTLLEGQSNKLVGLKAKLAGLDQEQTNLTQAKRDIAKYSDLYQIAKVVVPENKDQAEAVRQIVKLASQSNVNLDSITFPSSSLGAGSGSSTPSTSATTPSSTSSANAATNSLSQLTPVQNIPGVYELPITIQSANTTATGEPTYPELIAFLQALEQNRQTALVSSLNIQPDANNRNYLSFTLLMDIYIKPES